jgi:predicted LPLAT superfamily acyltransferase
MAAQRRPRPVNVIVHTANADRYNRLIERFSPESRVRLVEAASMGPAVAVQLAAAVERGEWVVIMGDLHPPQGAGRVVEVDFLGAPALLPKGPFILADLLDCPIHLLLCAKVGGRRRAFLTDLTDAEARRAGRREERVARLARRYASELERAVRTAPFQWFNFFDFWAPPAAAAAPAPGPGPSFEPSSGPMA